MAKRVWSDRDDSFIRENYGTLTNGDIAEQLGNCIALQVYRRAIVLGLQEEPARMGGESRQKREKVARFSSPAKRNRVLVEKEVQAMQAVVDALSPLDHEAQKRVIYYVNARLGILKFQSAAGGAANG